MKFSENLKSFGQLTKAKSISCWKFLDRHSWLFALIIGLILNFTTECLHRHSFVEGCLHVVKSPLPFLFGALIIATVLSVFTLFKKKYFYWTFIFCLFLGFGIANCVLLNLRVTPLEWADLQIVKISLITKYLNTFEIILVIVPIVTALIGLGFFFVKCPKLKVDYLKNSIVAGIYVIVLVSSLFTFRATDILLSKHTKNLANAYKDYGFYYCFLCSILDLGIDQPEIYTEEDVSSITSALSNAAENNEQIKNQAAIVQNGEKAPNVIFLQLETFFDVNHLSNVTFSENPIPNFTKLHNEFSSGYIGVPSIGAGTANTEFEVISGMSLEHFGMGEYPYKTVLQNNASESIGYNLKNHGYRTHAIHNNTATFYDRNLVFSNLGFDTFTSVEYMQNVEYTTTGWAKDKVLLQSITDCLDSSDTPDLVYTITVQGHGKYPSQYTDETLITAEGFDENDDTAREFTYYINQLYEVDKFIGELLDSLNQRNERTVVIMFGDHLPSFDIEPSDLDGGDLFRTEYVIWDNFGLKTQNGNIPAYQLSSHVMGLLGLSDGNLTKLHQNFKDSSLYDEYLRTLEYDMLYGKKYAYGGEKNYPFKTTDIKMGVKEIIIQNVERNPDGFLTVKGENFTEFSKIALNDKELDTVFVDNNTIMTEKPVEMMAGDLLAVIQVNSSYEVLSSSKLYLIGGTQDMPTVDTDSEVYIYRQKGLKLSTSIAIIVVGIAIISVSAMVIVLALNRRKKNN